MSEEEAGAEEQEPKKKGGLLKWILLGVGAIVMIVGTVVATLFLTGGFDQASTSQGVTEMLAEVEATALEEHEARVAPAAAGGTGGATGTADGPPPRQRRQPRQSPERERFEPSYLELERELIANVANSRRVIMVKLAVMTYYDQRVLDNVERHEFALRSAVLDILRMVTDNDLVQPDFRMRLARDIRLRMNELLEGYEDFGGIEEVHFTEFVVQ